MYIKEFEVRWNDIDANRHLANSAYVIYASHTRLSFMLEQGFGQAQMAEHNIGPVVFHEHMYYFKEVAFGDPIRVSLELKGLSDDGTYFSYVHNFYDSEGKNLARCEVIGGWIDLTKRKLTPPPAKLFEIINSLQRTQDFSIITKADTRQTGQAPIDL